MIDLHLHLLPAVDDGAVSLDVSLAMLELARSLGYDTLVATPHLDGPLTAAYEAKVRSALTVLTDAAHQRGMPIEIGLGYEIQLTPDLPARLAAGEPSRLARSSTVLVELPFAGWPIFTEQTLFAVQSLGIRPLLAHPERYAAVQADFEKVESLVERGVLLQVTLGSLVGLFGKHAQRVAEQLLKRDMVAVLASDAHSAGKRFVSVADGLARSEQLIGHNRTRQLVAENPLALLEDRPLPEAAEFATGELADRSWKKMLTRLRS